MSAILNRISRIKAEQEAKLAAAKLEPRDDDIDTGVVSSQNSNAVDCISFSQSDNEFSQPSPLSSHQLEQGAASRKPLKLRKTPVKKVFKRKLIWAKCENFKGGKAYFCARDCEYFLFLIATPLLFLISYQIHDCLF
jgi:hypothetical protein